MHVRMLRPLFLEQRVAAGEHDVGLGEQLSFALDQRGRCVLECDQLVHAVVDHGERTQSARQRQGHRRVEPEHVLLDRLFLE